MSYVLFALLCLRFLKSMKNTKEDFENQETESPRKLPLSNDSNNISDRFSSTEENKPLTSLHQLDALFLDTTLASCSYEHNMQELAEIESQYSELIKHHPSQDVVSFEARGRKLSTDEVIRLGGERFIQSCSSDHPYSSSFSGLSDQELKDIQLIENLLLASEKINQQQLERSSKLLDWCDTLSCSSGTPIQRIVYYFSRALRGKLYNETRTIGFTGSGKKHLHDLQGRIMNPNMTSVSIYQKLPFYQAGYFAGVQALVDRLSGSKKVHVIDLSIRQGVQTTILMQALASQPGFHIKLLKITAVGSDFKQQIKQTGDRLKSFAESINLSFSFNMVIVEDMLDFNKDDLKLDPMEALGVFASHCLSNMIMQQDRLEYLMKVIKSTNPRVMVVCEVATNLNSPSFVCRFIEALFFFGAMFDSLEDCMDRDDENRGIAESMYLGEGIRSIVGAEGEERAIRHVNIDVWRKFFLRFGMTEIRFSMSSLYQAKLVAEKFCCRSSCTFDMDGNSLVVGWKGTPILCLSAWKFS